MSQEYYDDGRNNYENEIIEKPPTTPEPETEPEAQLSQKETDGQKILRFLMERIQQLSSQKSSKSRYNSKSRRRNYDVSRFSRG